MATPKTPITSRDSFDVMTLRSVGTVNLSDEGTESPISAALRLIGEDGDNGTFEFVVPIHVLTDKAIKFTVTIASEPVES